MSELAPRTFTLYPYGKAFFVGWEYKTILRQRGWGANEPGKPYQWSQDWDRWFEDGLQLLSPTDMVAKLQELGKQGWELVSAFPLSSVLGGEWSRSAVDFAGYTTDEKWVLKRPLS